MYPFPSFRSRGQTIILVAVAAVALLAFVALAVDGGNAYYTRRQAQSAADGAAIAGTWVMVDYQGGSPVADILRKVNQYAERNGTPDTNGVPGDPINDNVLAYYVDADGNRLSYGGGDWELHAGPDVIPGGARGIEAVVTISRTTFFAQVVGWRNVVATAHATARYEPDGGVLPIAVNEYWEGSEGHCPYDHCGVPYSFVRDPGQLPPFREDPPGSDRWVKNPCPDPYNNNTCQGPYEGYYENFGKAFAILGGDAKPVPSPSNPRSGVELDYRYDALVDNGRWHYLVDNDQWLHNVSPPPQGDVKQHMEEIIKQGGYRKTPLPKALFEPPPQHIEEWGYCWALPENSDNCFNYPESNHSSPYSGLMFLYGTVSSRMAQAMYDEGNYVGGRYAPGERIVILVYNGYYGNGWPDNDVALVVGYFGAYIVGYGNNFDRNCGNRQPGNWQSYVDCVQGQPNTAYAIAAPSAPLTLDPTKLLNNFMPKKITLIK